MKRRRDSPPISSANELSELKPNPMGDATEWSKGLARRLHQVAQGKSLREMGRNTSTHPETIRRYLRDGAPCARFVAAFCKAYAVNCEWLLLGTGPMRWLAGSDDLKFRIVADLELHDGQLRVADASCRLVWETPPSIESPRDLEED